MGRGETNAKKRKRTSEVKGALNGKSATDPIDTSKPTAVFKPTKGRDWTVSVALPGSIIANAQSHDLRTSLAGQIARALSVFCIDEVVIFSDGDTKQTKPRHRTHQSQHGAHNHQGDGYTGTSNPDHFLVHLLSYLETPPHLRKHLFPLHPNLRTAGTLPSLDLPHHLRADEWCPYREGVTLPSTSQTARATTTLAEAGLRVHVTVDAAIPPSTRVTLKIPPSAKSGANDSDIKEIRVEAVDPAAPRDEGGYYWGYSVRQASNLSAVFEECPFDGGYDVTIGTSERGAPLESLFPSSVSASAERDTGTMRFKHLLLTLGGVSGLETALKNDAKLQELGVKDVGEVFDHWVNILPGQGSRTIRTEEALWIALMGLRSAVVRNGGEKQHWRHFVG